MKSEVLYKDDVNVGKKIRIVHFNDVYNIENRNGNGSSSRFIYAVEQFLKDEPTLVFFSGDAFSPSLLSSVFKGKQMVEILNLCHINAACVGNHEFDFGVDTMESLCRETNFPWLLSNVIDPETNRPLGGVESQLILDYEGLKIGVIGIVEENWLSTLSTIDPDDVIYEPYIEKGRSLALKLREEENVDVVIALTHMRRKGDDEFLKAIPEIDIVLGGHDHDYSIQKVHNENVLYDRWIVKSGVDFHEFTYIELQKTRDLAVVTLLEKIVINPDTPENVEAKRIMNKYEAELQKRLDIVIGVINTDLDGRFTSVRREETNLGNFLCDIIMQSADVDCCILNGGTLRSNKIHPKGDFTLRDLKEILSFEVRPVVLELTGKQIWRALENGVSQYPELEGRFPQVSGIKFAFDPSKPSLNRIKLSSIQVQNEPLDLERNYKVATDKYLSIGKDGYDVFKEGRSLMDDDTFPFLIDLVQNHFKAVEKVKKDSNARLRPSLVPIAFINSVVQDLSNDPTIFEASEQDAPRVTFRTASKLILETLKLHQTVSKKQKKILIKQSSKYKEIIQEYEKKALALAPTVESRIICIKHENEN